MSGGIIYNKKCKISQRAVMLMRRSILFSHFHCEIKKTLEKQAYMHQSAENEAKRCGYKNRSSTCWCIVLIDYVYFVLFTMCLALARIGLSFDHRTVLYRMCLVSLTSTVFCSGTLRRRQAPTQVSDWQPRTSALSEPQIAISLGLGRTAWRI